MKKLLAALKKLIGMSSEEKGFTLVELLVVIAILGILLVGSLVAINPAQKINQAKDASQKSSIDQVAGAMQSYFTQNTYYPAAVADLVPGELSSEPKDASGAVFNVNCKQADGTTACTTAGKNGTTVAVSFTLALSDTTTTVAKGAIGADCTVAAPCTKWCWKSSVGKAGPSAACTAP